MEVFEGARARRLRTRWIRRAAIALCIGAALGGLVGYVLARVSFDTGSRGFWGAIVGAMIFTTLVALLVASYSSLESPDPSTEPSQVDRPIGDRPGLVREESSTSECAPPSDPNP